MTELPIYLARPRVRSTTVLGVRRDGALALAGDGQVTSGDVVLKHGARKVRTLYDGQVLAGFAGAVADALTLFAKFEQQLKAWDGNLRRAAVELTKEWRSDRYLRRLEAQLLVGDAGSLLILSGDGDVIEPDDGIAAIGSGSAYATAAAKALLSHTDMTATAIVEAAMTIAADICIYTNNRFSIETVAGGTDVDEDEAEELPLDGYLPPVDTPATEDELDDEDEENEQEELIEYEDEDDAEER